MYRSRRVAAVVLAGNGSGRPNAELLLPFGEGTVFSGSVERLGACEWVDEIVVATTDAPEGDALAQEAERLGVAVFRTGESDVVQQMLLASDSLAHCPDVIVRSCADNPLVMPTVVDAGIRDLVDSGADVLTPLEHATLPQGFGLVCMTEQCLERIDAAAVEFADRQQFENYCFARPSEFTTHYQLAPDGLDYPELCLTINQPSDYERLTRLNRLLTGVPLNRQPQTLLKHVQSPRVWIEGTTSGQPQHFELVVSSAPLDLPAPPSLGHVVVDTMAFEGVERFVLRYANCCGPDFPRGPLFMDRRARRAGDTPASFLGYALPIALPALRAAPARVVGCADTESKGGERAGAGRREGFLVDRDQDFPPRIQFVASGGAADSGSDPSTELLAKLLAEIEPQIGSSLVMSEGAEPALVRQAVEVLGPQRVTRGDAATDPFECVSLDARGWLRTGGQRAEFGGASITSFWNSARVRRTRATVLNGNAA